MRVLGLLCIAAPAALGFTINSKAFHGAVSQYQQTRTETTNGVRSLMAKTGPEMGRNKVRIPRREPGRTITHLGGTLSEVAYLG